MSILEAIGHLEESTASATTGGQLQLEEDVEPEEPISPAMGEHDTIYAIGYNDLTPVIYRNSKKNARSSTRKPQAKRANFYGDGNPPRSVPPKRSTIHGNAFSSKFAASLHLNPGEVELFERQPPKRRARRRANRSS